jgi:hypothetical protein
MKSFRDDYRSYLLRMWRVSVEEEIDWRASLEDVMTGEKRGFSNLAALLNYLQGLACTKGKAEALHK